MKGMKMFALSVLSLAVLVGCTGGKTSQDKATEDALSAYNEIVSEIQTESEAKEILSEFESLTGHGN